MSSLDPYFPNFEEAEELAADAEIFWQDQRQQRAELYSLWQDYEEILFMCDKCKRVFQGEDAEIDHESDLVVALLCPKCSFKLGILQTEADSEELQKLASLGHKKAISAIKTRESSNED
jgi:hypothetical protein